MRRVLFHLSNAFSLEQKIGGAETAALVIMRGLRGLGWEPHVLMHAEGLLAEQLDRNGIPWRIAPLPVSLESLSRNQRFLPIRAAAAIPGLMLLTAEVSKLIREWDIDIVHAHHLYAYLSCGMAAKARGVPCVWHLHESWQPGLLSGILTQAGHLFANHVITIAEYETMTVSRLIRHTGHTLILNAFDFDELGASQKLAASEVPAEFGVASNEILVGYVSHLAPYKGQRTFVHAFARLVDEVPSCRAVIVGGPRKFCEWFRDELLEDVRKLGMAERVRFTGVRLDLADIMNALDVFVCASENQEFNRVLVEAMYFAKPVIASDLRGGSIVAETGRTGILVPPRDQVAMARALVRLAKDSALRRKLGASAHEYVLATFPYRKITPMYVDVYSRLLARN